MSKKELFDDELVSGMQQHMHKYASAETPKLARAAECLHAALEILEEQGLHARADQVLQLLEKLAQGPIKTAAGSKVHSLQQIMDAGVSQRDLNNFARGEPRAIAKLNLVLRRLGMSEHEIAKFLGHGKLMSEEQAHKALNPNEPGSTLEFEGTLSGPGAKAPEAGPESELLEFKSLAQKKSKKPGRPGLPSDPHTKGLTPAQEVKNLTNHGTVFNMADDGCAVDVPARINKDSLRASDVDAEFADLLTADMFEASDDELMGMEIKEDSLEVFDTDNVVEDFEDERD